MQDHEQIARLSTPCAGLAVARGTQTRTALDASWDFDLVLGRFLAPARAVAGMARLVNNTAQAFATRAGLRDAENAARTDDLAASAAHRASLGRGAVFRPAAVAGFARAEFAGANFLLAALGGLEKSQFHVVTQIITALGAAGASFAAAE